MYLPTKEDGAAEQGTIRGTPLFVMKEFSLKKCSYFSIMLDLEKGREHCFLVFTET